MGIIQEDNTHAEVLTSQQSQFKEGPNKIISGKDLHPCMRHDRIHDTFFLLQDSLFSLIIFIYVSVSFLYVFYAFCWFERQQINEYHHDGYHLVKTEESEPHSPG